MYMSKEDLSLAGEVRVDTGWIIRQEKNTVLYDNSKPATDTNQKAIWAWPSKRLCNSVMRLHSGIGSQNLLILNLKQPTQALCPLPSDLYFLLHGKGLWWLLWFSERTEPPLPPSQVKLAKSTSKVNFQDQVAWCAASLIFTACVSPIILLVPQHQWLDQSWSHLRSSPLCFFVCYLPNTT